MGGLADGHAVTAGGVEALYRQHFHDVLRAVLPVVGRMAVAEEVVQDAFEVADREWQRVAGYERPDLWVRRVALNRAISAMRRSGREGLVADPFDGPDLGTQWSADSSAVLDALRTLPDRQVEVTVLVYFGGLRVAEAARALEISESSARTHHRRALEALEPLLADETRSTNLSRGGD